MHHHHHHHLTALSAQTASKVAMEMCMKKNWPNLFMNVSSILLFRFLAVTHHSPNCDRNIIRIRGMFAIGCTHKLHIIILCNFLFVKLKRFPVAGQRISYNRNAKILRKFGNYEKVEKKLH